MKKWNGTGSASSYIFYVICFGIGFVIVKGLSLGQLAIAEPDNHDWRPIARQPDGQLAIGDFTVSTIGFAVLMAICGLLSLARG